MLSVVRVVREVRAVQVVRVVSLDSMHSESIRFTWSKLSNFGEKSRCHACDSMTTGHSKRNAFAILPEFAIRNYR